MDQEINAAMNHILGKLKEVKMDDAALRYSQAVLNLAHVKATLHNIKNYKN